MKRILLGVLMTFAVCASAQTLENDSLAILFSGPSSGFAVTGIVNKASGGGRFVSASGVLRSLSPKAGALALLI